MTSRISRTVFAMALALGMLAAVSNPSRAALSTADRTDSAVASAPAPEAATLAAVSAPAPATHAAVAPVAAAAVPVADQPRKTVAHKAKPQRFAARIAYPCH